jgi:hypothetical protein
VSAEHKHASQRRENIGGRKEGVKPLKLTWMLPHCQLQLNKLKNNHDDALAIPDAKGPADDSVYRR